MAGVAFKFKYSISSQIVPQAKSSPSVSVSHVKRAQSLFSLSSLSAIQCELPRNPQNGRAVYASVSVSSSRRLRDSPNLTQSNF